MSENPSENLKNMSENPSDNLKNMSENPSENLEKSLDFVTNKLKVKYIKIGSSELNNLEFLKKVSKKKRPIIFSSGMGTFEEIKKAYRVCKKNSLLG